MAEHRFGGLWTRKKIEILQKYLSFYTQALKNFPFTLHYADAFAGTGSHVISEDDGLQETLLCEEVLKGSVVTALEVNPGFHHYHFNDLNPDHVNELHQICKLHSSKAISITGMDANLFVPSFCNTLTVNDRAVLFIDPYSSQLNWGTLQAISQSHKVDVWLLFPLSVILRMAPTDADRIRPEWRDTHLGQTLGRLSYTNQHKSLL